jgi:hypothetical protein
MPKTFAKKASISVAAVEKWPGWFKVMVKKANQSALPMARRPGIAALATFVPLHELARGIFRL